MRLTLVTKIGFGFLLLAAAEGCGGGALSQPFEGMKSAPITVYRLQNYEPPPQPAAAAGAAALPIQLPPQLQQWATAAASMLPAGLIPPGILPGSAPAPAADPAAQVPRFHDFRILGWVPLQDQKQHDELLDVLGHDSSFVTPKESCMFAEFGISIAQQGQPAADILVSLSCNSVRTFGFAWPYGNNTAMSSDASKRIIEVMKKAFGGG